MNVGRGTCCLFCDTFNTASSFGGILFSRGGEERKAKVLHLKEQMARQSNQEVEKRRRAIRAEEMGSKQQDFERPVSFYGAETARHDGIGCEGAIGARDLKSKRLSANLVKDPIPLHFPSAGC